MKAEAHKYPLTWYGDGEDNTAENYRYVHLSLDMHNGYKTVIIIVINTKAY